MFDIYSEAEKVPIVRAGSPDKGGFCDSKYISNVVAYHTPMKGGVTTPPEATRPVTLALSGSSTRFFLGHTMHGKPLLSASPIPWLFGPMLEQFRSIINDLQDKTMVDYMRAGESLPEDEPDAFEGTRFSRIPEVKHANEEELDVILSQARKILNAAKRNGSVSDDEAIQESLALPSEYVEPASFYAYKVGPVAATHDELQWTSAYRMNPEDAEHHKSDTFRKAASELQIPDTLEMKLGPKFIISAYRVLYEHTEETGRPIHPYKIRAEANVVLPERAYPQAFRYLNDLPGVEPPETDGPAWVYVDESPEPNPEGSHV
jgi:hypothetical protein